MVRPTALLQRQLNYYTPFTFTRVGPSAVATFTSTARSRGQVGGRALVVGRFRASMGLCCASERGKPVTAVTDTCSGQKHFFASRGYAHSHLWACTRWGCRDVNVAGYGSL